MTVLNCQKIQHHLDHLHCLGLRRCRRRHRRRRQRPRRLQSNDDDHHHQYFHRRRLVVSFIHKRKGRNSYLEVGFFLGKVYLLIIKREVLVLGTCLGIIFSL